MNMIGNRTKGDAGKTVVDRADNHHFPIHFTQLALLYSSHSPFSSHFGSFNHW